MTPEQRLDRVVRILGYFVREGRRWRVRSREQNERINILIHSQIEIGEYITRVTAAHDKELAALERSQELTQQSLRAFFDRIGHKDESST